MDVAETRVLLISVLELSEEMLDEGSEQSESYEVLVLVMVSVYTIVEVYVEVAVAVLEYWVLVATGRWGRYKMRKSRPYRL